MSININCIHLTVVSCLLFNKHNSIRLSCNIDKENISHSHSILTSFTTGIEVVNHQIDNTAMYTCISHSKAALKSRFFQKILNGVRFLV